MILLNFEKLDLNQKTIEFIKALRSSLPFLEKKKVEKSMGLSKAQLNKALKGEIELSAIQVTKLSRDFHFSLKALKEGEIDLDSLIRKFQGKTSGIPKRYKGKKPSVKNFFIIGNLNYIEKFHGPNLKKLALEYLQLEDHLYKDPQDFVNLQVLEDLLSFLNDHGLTDLEIIEIGAHAINGVLSLSPFPSLENPQEFLKYFFEEFATKVAASHYIFKPIINSTSELVVQVTDSPTTMEYMQEKPLGNPFICLHMLGGFSEALKFKGIHQFEKFHTKCRHRGDEVCLFEFKYH